MIDLASLPAYSPLQWLVIGAFPGLMLAAAVTDAAEMRIPNWLTGALALAFPVAAAGTSMPLEGLGLHAMVGLAGLLVGMGLFAMGWIGGGDAKFFAATLLWLGPETAIAYTLVSTVLGGILTLFLLAFRRVPMPAPLAARDWVMRLHDPAQGVPYGMALAVGGLILFAESSWMAGGP